MKKTYTAPCAECTSLTPSEVVAALRPVQSEIELVENGDEE